MATWMILRVVLLFYPCGHLCQGRYCTAFNILQFYIFFTSTFSPFNNSNSYINYQMEMGSWDLTIRVFINNLRYQGWKQKQTAGGSGGYELNNISKGWVIMCDDMTKYDFAHLFFVGAGGANISYMDTPCRSLSKMIRHLTTKLRESKWKHLY